MGLIPSASEIVGAATSVRHALAETVDQAVGSVGGALALVPQAQTLLTRVGLLVDRIDAVVDHAELVIGRIDEVVGESDATVERVNLVATKADRTMSGATGLVDRADSLLTSVEPVARQAIPIATKLVESISTQEVDAGVSLLDRLPTVLAHLEDDVLPLLRQLEAVGPDVHAILETVQDLTERIEALPGMGLLRKRADKDEDRPAG